VSPTVTFVGGLSKLGGIGYILLGGGFVLVFSAVAFARDLVAWLLPLSIALLFSGTTIVVVWQILEYRVSTQKLRMIISLTELMVEKQISAQAYVDHCCPAKETSHACKLL
jgi:hypothetical protein